MLPAQSAPSRYGVGEPDPRQHDGYDQSVRRFALYLAMGAAWPLAATDARAERPCPSDTYFQGIACVHARETCGGWDGTSCAPGSGPVPRDQSTRDEYARIDRDAKAICTEDATA